jgi:RNA polymerase sigma factor for flagellar operon FliA
MPQESCTGDANQHENELLERALPIINRMARRTYHRLGRRIELDELRSICLTTMLRALQHYDPERTRFPAYLTQRLNWGVAGEVRKRSRRFNLNRGMPCGVAERYCDRLPRRLGTKAGANRARISSVLERDHALSGTLRPSGDVEDTAMCTAHDPEQALARKRVHAALRDVLTQLPALERTLLKRHYFGGERFSHVARDMGISKSRANRLHRAALDTAAQQLRELGYRQPVGQP